MNTIEDFYFTKTTTYDYSYDLKDSEDECSVHEINRWLDDFGWL